MMTPIDLADFKKRLGQAADLYAEGGLSLGEAAGQFGVERLDLIYELERRNYPMMEGITEKEAEDQIWELIDHYRPKVKFA